MRRAAVTPRSSGAGLALLALLQVGCPSLLTMGPARTVAPGSSESYLAAGAYRTVLVTGTNPTERTTEWMPLFDAGLRVGLNERMDLGARIGLGGGSIGPRVQLVRASSTDAGVDLLIEPSFGVTGVLPGAHGGIVTGTYVALALPFGVNLGRGSQLVLTPRFARVFDRFVGDVNMPGGSVALVLRVAGSDSQPWFIIPECGAAAVRGLGRSFDGPALQCALGLAGPWR
jgi:hypothetical protein